MPPSGVVYEFERALIESVRIRAYLYLRTAHGFNDRETQTVGWGEVAAATGRTVGECMKRWRTLKDSYFRLKKDQQDNYQRSERQPWAYYELLTFLNDDCLRSWPRKRKISKLDDSGDVDRSQMFDHDYMDIQCNSASDASVDRCSNNMVKAETLRASEDKITCAAKSKKLKDQPSTKSAAAIVVAAAAMASAKKYVEDPLMFSVENRRKSVANINRKQRVDSDKSRKTDDNLNFLMKLKPLLTDTAKSLTQSASQQQQPVQLSQPQDDDLHFCLSLTPYLRQMTDDGKLCFKVETWERIFKNFNEFGKVNSPSCLNNS